MDESESEKRFIRDIDILNRSNSQNKRTRDIGQKKRTNKIGIINSKHFVAKLPMIRISFPLELLIKSMFLCMLVFQAIMKPGIRQSRKCKVSSLSEILYFKENHTVN